MPMEKPGRKVDWYRSPVDREAMAALNQRSDWKGSLQTLGFLGLLALTGAAAWYASIRFLPVVFLLLVFLHGTFWAFLLNAFHEFCHRTVFKTKFLNAFFLQVVSFLSWNNPYQFWTSHQEHHKYTLFPPDDLEVVLPVKLTFAAFLKTVCVNPWDFYTRLRGFFRWSAGRLEGEWENAIFPESARELRRNLFRWSRLFLLCQALIAVTAVAFGWWQVIVLFTFAPFYAGGLQWLCNNTQHAGLVDKTPDYRLCCRTILLNPFLQFLYWHMNFHTEHHMYAAVPCYNLGKLHRLIHPDLPLCTGLWQAWQEIIMILKKQLEDPGFQYAAKLPR